jgi:hypothetical protein
MYILYNVHFSIVLFENIKHEHQKDTISIQIHSHRGDNSGIGLSYRPARRVPIL